MVRTSTEGSDDHAEHSRWATFAVLAVAQFIVVMDASIVYVALPSIQRQMGFSQTGLAWVMDAYILAFSGVMLLGGRAADMFGRRRVLLFGLIWFGVASLGCGLTTAPWQIITARAVQGVGAAIVAPTTLALVTDTFEEGRERFKALGIFGSIGGFAGAVGVCLGGLLTSISWRWAFLVNVPIAFGVLVATIRMLPARPPVARGGMDVAGMLTSTGGLCLLLFAILRASVQGWSSPPFALELAGGVIVLALFAVRQLSARAPLIPRSLFAERAVVLGNVANTSVGALLFGVFFVLTLYLQVVRGYSPLQAALRMAPVSLALFAGSNLISRMLRRINPDDSLLVGMVIQVSGLAWWAASLGAARPLWTSFLLPAMVWAFGCGIALASAFVVCTSGLAGPVMGAASGLVSVTLQVGGAIGVVVLTVVSNRQVAGMTRGERASVLAGGQATALWAAVGIAAVAIPFLLWLRFSRASSIREKTAPGHPADSSEPPEIFAQQ
jgi:EmrB/QacA subfamily drug resistance transporter